LCICYVLKNSKDVIFAVDKNLLLSVLAVSRFTVLWDIDAGKKGI
jgi:hypothetical protein